MKEDKDVFDTVSEDNEFHAVIALGKNELYNIVRSELGEGQVHGHELIC